jgi:hypothetical protein
MTRIRFGRLAATGLAIALTFAAAMHVRADAKTFKAIQSAISRSGHIPITGSTQTRQSGAATTTSALAHYIQLKQALHSGTARTVPAVRAATRDASGSQITQIGSPPTGYGSVFQWDRSQPSCLLLIFVNPADTTGVAIAGLSKGDKVQVLGATGLCSFSKDTGNPLLSSIITLVADGAADAVSIFAPGGGGGSGAASGGTGSGTTGSGGKSGSGSGASSAVQAIEQTGKDLAGLFKGTGAAEKFRDPFGLDPGTHGYALEEGGVVVCMPQGNGLYYSSDHDHRNFWASNPPAMGQARRLPAGYSSLASNPPFFFLGQNANNTAYCQTDGIAYLLAWDFAYGDNAGFYEVWVQLTQGPSIGTSPAAPASPAVARKARASR